MTAVLPTGRVTLRVPARLQYDIDLAPSEVRRKGGDEDVSKRGLMRNTR